MDTLLIFGAVSLVGVILGAGLQYLFSQRAEQRRGIEVRRTEAYVELIKSVAALAGADDNTPPEQLRQAKTAFAEARARVAIYGSANVVSCLGKFLRSSSLENHEISINALTEVVKTMRAESQGVGILSDDDLKLVLFRANRF